MRCAGIPYTRVYLWIFDPGPSNPTTFLGLCFPGDYRQSIVSNGCSHLKLYRKDAYIHYLWLYSENTAKKGVFFTKVSPLNVELIWHAPSVECAVPVYRLTASKGLRNTFLLKFLLLSARSAHYDEKAKSTLDIFSSKPYKYTFLLRKWSIRNPDLKTE